MFTMLLLNLHHLTVVKPETLLEMKQKNPLWGCKKIDIHYTTVNKIIQTFRKQGRIQATGSWKRFCESALGLVICHGFHDYRYLIWQEIISPSDP